MKKWMVIISLFISSNIWALEKTESQVVQLEVTDNGFQPKSIDVKKDTPITLQVTRKTDSTCATQIQVPSLYLKKDLPLNKMVSIDIGKLKKGELRFGCGMNMMDAGVIHAK